MEEVTAYRQKGKDAMFKVWHASDTGLIMYMHSDGGSIVCAEKAYPIQKGVLCFIGKGKYHCTVPENSALYERSKIFVHPSRQAALFEVFSVYSRYRNFCDGAFVYALIPEEERGAVERIFENAIRNAEATAFGEIFLLGATLELLAYLDKYALKSAPKSEGFMNRAIEYINKNLSAELSVDAICAAAHVSKYHFCRCFKRTVGMTVMAYVLKARLAAAKELLQGTEISVTDIALRCGFESPAYFSRVFKADTGLSPLRYRKNKRTPMQI